MAQLDSYIAVGGPFDGVMGFSAGAVVAALYMADKHRRGEQSPFKCAVFLSAAKIIEEQEYLGFNVAKRPLIQVPTAHIWGANDLTAPTGGHDLSRLCEPALVQTIIHDGGHEIPRKGYLTDAVHAIRRTIFAAA